MKFREVKDNQEISQESDLLYYPGNWIDPIVQVA